MKKKLLLLLFAFVLVCSNFVVASAEEDTKNYVYGTQAVEAIDSTTIVTIDVRSKANYDKGHLKGSISLPLFAADGTLPDGTDDDLSKAFDTAVRGNQTLAGKSIYILCNSGSKGAAKATTLLIAAGYSNDVIFTIKGGAMAKDVEDKSVLQHLTYVSGDYALSVAGTEGHVIIDVRAAELYATGHLKGSVSLPLFTRVNTSNVPVPETYDDALSQAFLKYVTDNKATLAGKSIYILCNSGKAGVTNALALLAKAEITENVYPIEGGAAGLAGKLTYVSGDQALSVVGNEEYLIIDVRATKRYDVGHLNGSVSLPLFTVNEKDENVAVKAPYEDELSKAFVKYVADNKTALAGKKGIYILCNSGATGAANATTLLAQEGITSNVYTIENGAKGLAGKLTFVSEAQALSVVDNKDYVIIDVRAAKRYEAGHLKGSISLPLFTVDANDKNVPVAEPYTDELSKAFVKYVTDNKETLAGKTIYILCNSGATGAKNGTILLAKAGITENVYTIEGGATKNASIQAAFVKDAPVAPKTGDMAPTMGYILVMFAAAAVIIASKKKLAK